MIFLGYRVIPIGTEAVSAYLNYMPFFPGTSEPKCLFPVKYCFITSDHSGIRAEEGKHGNVQSQMFEQINMAAIVEREMHLFDITV